MKDPERIDKILNEIRRIWKESPDLRFVQLVVNASQGRTNPYYLEDDVLLENLKKTYK